MANEASFSVSGYVATEPKPGVTKGGARSLYMRVGWTPRWLDRATGDWADQPTSFVSVICYRKVAENAAGVPAPGRPDSGQGHAPGPRVRSRRAARRQQLST